jgi:hypothetical protein
MTPAKRVHRKASGAETRSPACTRSRRTPYEPAGQRREQLRTSRMTASGRLQFNHCSTTPGKTGTAQLPMVMRPHRSDLAKHRAT